MATTHRRSWVDAPVAEVAAHVLRGDGIASWIDAVRSATGGDLRQIGSTAEVTFTDRRGTRGTLRTTRTVRDAVHLDVIVHGRQVGDLWLSASPWDGGTALEVVADLPAALARRRWSRRAARAHGPSEVRRPVEVAGAYVSPPAG